MHLAAQDANHAFGSETQHLVETAAAPVIGNHHILEQPAAGAEHGLTARGIALGHLTELLHGSESRGHGPVEQPLAQAPQVSAISADMLHAAMSGVAPLHSTVESAPAHPSMSGSSQGNVAAVLADALHGAHGTHGLVDVDSLLSAIGHHGGQHGPAEHPLAQLSAVDAHVAGFAVSPFAHGMAGAEALHFDAPPAT
jgi:hypothetical protein